MYEIIKDYIECMDNSETRTSNSCRKEQFLNIYKNKIFLKCAKQYSGYGPVS